MKNAMTKYKKWFPQANMPEEFYFESMVDNAQNLTLLLSSPGQSGLVKIVFEDHIGYRVFNESERLKTLNRHIELMDPWSLFESNNTEFVDWLVEEASGTVESGDIHHFLIKTPDEIIEVLSWTYPNVGILG